MLCVAMLFLDRLVWRFLAGWRAGWLANPQGSCGGKSLAGSVGVAGVVRCGAGDSREWPCLPWRPLGPLPSLSGTQLQRSCRVHIKCRNGQPTPGTIGQWERRGRVGYGRERQD